MTAAEARMQIMLGRQVERIAVVRALYLGDMVLAVPALRALRSGFPAATITLIGLPWARDFANRFGPYVDDFMELVSFPGIDEVSADPVRTAEFIEELSTLQDNVAGRARLAELNPVMHFVEILRQPLLGQDIVWRHWWVAGVITVLGWVAAMTALRNYRSRVAYWV